MIICILHGQHKGKNIIILDASSTKLASSARPCLKGKTDEKLKGLSAMDYLIPGGGGGWGSRGHSFHFIMPPLMVNNP